MSQPPPRPTLTPQFCFNERALRDFLRLSRSALDDSITQNLNALATPSSQPFDPASTSIRQSTTSPPTTQRYLSTARCATFKSSLLFPTWQSRSDVLSYCAGVATSDDPDDPDVLTRQVEKARERERVVDERLDPYSGRFFPREARTEKLAGLVRSERGVETVVRARTWGVVGDRCSSGGGEDEGWEAAMDKWREEEERGRKGKD